MSWGRVLWPSLGVLAPCSVGSLITASVEAGPRIDLSSGTSAVSQQARNARRFGSSSKPQPLPTTTSAPPVLPARSFGAMQMVGRGPRGFGSESVSVYMLAEYDNEVLGMSSVFVMGGGAAVGRSARHHLCPMPSHSGDITKSPSPRAQPKFTARITMVHSLMYALAQGSIMPWTSSGWDGNLKLSHLYAYKNPLCGPCTKYIVYPI